MAWIHIKMILTVAISGERTWVGEGVRQGVGGWEEGSVGNGLELFALCLWTHMMRMI